MVAVTRSRRGDAPASGLTPAMAPGFAPMGQFIEQAQTAVQSALERCQRDFCLACEEMSAASDLRTLMTLQLEWNATQWARAAELNSSLWSAALDTQSAFCRDLERTVRSGLQPMTGVSSSGSGPFVVPAPAADDLTPQAFVQRAAAPWLMLSQVWLSAVDHDLGESKATAPP